MNEGLRSMLTRGTSNRNDTVEVVVVAAHCLLGAIKLIQTYIRKGLAQYLP